MFYFFFFNDTATTEIYTLSLHDALPISFEGDWNVEASISPSGQLSLKSEPPDLMDAIGLWQLERVILRQDEVAAFVTRQKGDKYSVLLPLLGLEGLEKAAENFRKLNKSLSDAGQLRELRERRRLLATDALRHLPDVSEESALDLLNGRAADYLGVERPAQFQELADALLAAIRQLIDMATPEQTRHVLFKQIGDEELSQKLDALIKAKDQTSAHIDRLLDSRIAILEAAAIFADESDRDVDRIECPACGQVLKTEDFAQHVASELQGLRDLRAARDRENAARESLRNSLTKTRANLQDVNVLTWLDDPAQSELKTA